MAFAYKTNLLGNSHPVLRKVIANNSIAVQPGDAVDCYNAGFARLATAGNAIFGIVHAVVDRYGRGVLPEEDSRVEAGDWTVASGVVTVGSDNTTDDQIALLCDVSQYSIYSADVTGTIGTTNNSDKVGANIDVTDEDDLAETSAVRTISGQFYGWGTDPDDSGNILCSIRESEIFGGTPNYG